MRISVFGLGYVGCVSAACFAEAGHQVVGVDVNRDKVDMVNQGKSPIIEPGLADLIESVVHAGHLRATDSSADAVHASDLAMICVGTPGYATGQLDTGALQRLCHEVGARLRDANRPYTIVLRSTVLPGTVLNVVAPALYAGMGGELPSGLRIAVNPEFMREGTALKDFASPPFTLVGSDDTAASHQLRELYAAVDAPFVETGIRTAEMVKYAGNVFHALKVCFANEIGDVCEALGADPQEVMRIFRMDRKLNVSDAYLHPGFAFGGSCLPKDLRALMYAARANDVDLPLINSIIPSNRGQIERAVDTVVATRKRRIGVVGLSFKPNTDDLRESPAVTLVETLIGKGYDVRILDRNVSLARLVGANRRYIEEEIPHIASLMCADLDELLAHSEVLVTGNTGEDTERAVAAAGPAVTVVDLTRGVAAERMLAPGGEAAAASVETEPRYAPPPGVMPAFAARRARAAGS